VGALASYTRRNDGKKGGKPKVDSLFLFERKLVRKWGISRGPNINDWRAFTTGAEEGTKKTKRESVAGPSGKGPRWTKKGNDIFNL